MDGARKGDGATVSPVFKFKTLANARARARESRALRALFEPASVAVVGASAREGSVGQAVFRNLLMNGYTGTIYPVNPTRKSVMGVKCYPSLLEIDDPVDMAVVVIPAAAVPELLDRCAEKGVGSAIVISAGFKESGAEGAELEACIRSRARQGNIALLGPNCLGLINTDPAVSMNASFARRMALPGNVAFMSQSGALCTSILDYALGNNIGFSKFISFGNKADINENDLLRYLADDPQTQVILMYIEDLTDGLSFMHIAREITETSGKPVLAIKTGRTPEGASAAASHTGSLAGADEVYDAVMSQAGVLRVDTVQELFDYAMAFGHQPMPKSGRVAIVTNAGGPGIMATDACVRYGLSLARFGEGTTAALKAALPPTASVKNPVDVIGDARHDRYEAALRAVVEDGDTGGVIVILTPQTMTDIEEVAGVVTRVSAGSDKPVLASFMGLVDVSPGVAIVTNAGGPGIMATDACVRYGLSLARFGEGALSALKSALPPTASVKNPVDVIGDARHDRYETALKAVIADEDTGGAIVILTPQTMTDIEEVAQVVVRASAGSDKPVLASFMGLVDVSPGVEMLRRHGVPHYPFPEQAARVMKAMCDYERWLKRPRTVEQVFDVDRGGVQRVFQKALESGRTHLPELEALEVLKFYGFPVLKSGLARTREEVSELAEEIGFPLVMKIASPDILHKTDVGGVAVGIQSVEAAEKAFERMVSEARRQRPDADIWGVNVQEMARKGREVILGATRDPNFGPLVMFGMGGIYTEALRDVTFRLAPLRRLSARNMLAQIRGRKILEGIRGEDPADLDALQECLERLSQLVVEFPMIKELDINPLIAYPEGAVAVDARIILEM